MARADENWEEYRARVQGIAGGQGRRPAELEASAWGCGILIAFVLGAAIWAVVLALV